MKILATYLLCLGPVFLWAQNISVTSDTVCLGEQTYLSVTSDSSGVEYLWDLNFDGFFDDASGDSITHVFTDSHNQFVKVKAVFAGGSSAVSDQTHSVVIHPLPSVDFAIVGSCAEERTELYNHSNSSDSASYEWTIFSADTAQIFSIQEWDARYIFQASGEYLVQLSTTSGFGCKNGVVKSHIVHPELQVSVSHETSVCAGDTIKFMPQYDEEASVQTLIWKFGDGEQVIANDAQLYQYTQGGEYTVSLVSVSDKQCKDTTTSMVTVSELPKVEFVYNNSTLLYDGYVVELGVVDDFSSYKWSDQTESENLQVSETGTYSVTVTNDAGCSSTDSIFFEFFPKPKLSVKTEILTPNGDGYNDIFEVEQIEAYQACSLSIMNAEGHEVFTKNSYQNDWDGQVEGEILSPGVYFYKVSADSEVETGSIHILH